MTTDTPSAQDDWFWIKFRTVLGLLLSIAGFLGSAIDPVEPLWLWYVFFFGGLAGTALFTWNALRIWEGPP